MLALESHTCHESVKRCRDAIGISGLWLCVTRTVVSRADQHLCEPGATNCSRGENARQKRRDGRGCSTGPAANGMGWTDGAPPSWRRAPRCSGREEARQPMGCGALQGPASVSAAAGPLHGTLTVFLLSPGGRNIFFTYCNSPLQMPAAPTGLRLMPAAENPSRLPRRTRLRWERVHGSRYPARPDSWPCLPCLPDCPGCREGLVAFAG
jgi:hypothetical protein